MFCPPSGVKTNVSAHGLLVFNWFSWSFHICIYCNYGNLDLLAFIVLLLITFFTLVDLNLGEASCNFIYNQTLCLYY